MKKAAMQLQIELHNPRLRVAYFRFDVSPQLRQQTLISIAKNRTTPFAPSIHTACVVIE
jgi:hypothetical protein